MSSFPRDPPADSRDGAPGELDRLANQRVGGVKNPIRLERVHGRSAFLALRRSRRRSGSGVVRVHYDAAPPGDVARRVAYSVPRRVGKATERNRCRRRLREVAREVVSQLPPGAYLIGVEAGAGSISFGDLRRLVVGAMTRASRAGEQ